MDVVEYQLECRSMTSEDVALVAQYWANLKSEDMQRMGVDESKLPDLNTLKQNLNHQLSLPIEERRSYATIWYVNKEQIGHCNVNPFEFDKEGFLHLHVWKPLNRNKGLGTKLVELSVRHFFKELSLKTIYSEPFAENTAPNATLPKVGFKKMKTYETIPGSINFLQRVNRWQLKREEFKF
ncbi:MAG: GNAT family N-acetyltransferase [Schleiferiaceae bacterium]|nr:GNAT family N-acetyltransferase [Schleiferiaceae bacterium]